MRKALSIKEVAWANGFAPVLAAPIEDPDFEVTRSQSKTVAAASAFARAADLPKVWVGPTPSREILERG